MAKSVGLRTEIIFHITLLLGAALLFGGFLMLKVTEGQLLGQRINGHRETMQLASRFLVETLTVDEIEIGLNRRIARLLQPLSRATALGVWKLEGGLMTPLYVHSPDDRWLSNGQQLQSLRLLDEVQELVNYSSAWLAWDEVPACYFQTTVPIHEGGKLIGILQARFSLDEVAHRVRSSLKILLLYVVLYGTVLFLFGLYLLNRNVVRPIGILMATTRRVAAGDLGQQVSETGPLEIASLARSFNAMVVALRESRRHSDDYIRSLQQANEELQQARSELLRSEKMASIGHLAAGMAHEVGNPLAAVVGYLDLLKAELAPGRQQEIAGFAAGEAGRIDRLVRELLDYAKPGKDLAEVFAPLMVLQEALALLDHQGLFVGVQLIEALPQQLPCVNMVRHRLLQVFVNLLVNARDASPEGGEIRLAGGENAATVWLSIADGGTGISEQNLVHIFDPFFTTKAPGKGRGLGLAVCHRVVEEAGGTIEVQSAAGLGSVFTVRLKKEVDRNAD